jgi:FkbM family methyltransferase
MHVAEGNEVYPYAAADFEQEDVPFTVVEDSGAYTDQTLSAHSFSALSIREDFARYRGGMVHSLNHREIRVSVRRLDTILEQAAPPVDTVDVVSIDVEGYELDVMRGFSPHRYRVRVIILENLFHKDEYTEYMRSIDYKLWKKLGYNYFYIPDPARPVEPA